MCPGLHALVAVGLLLCAALGFADADAAPQPPGALDPTFGIAGAVHSSFVPAAVLPQPDGGIVAAGSAPGNGAAGIMLSRYLPDGTIDATFGQGGTATVPLPMVAPDAYAVVAAAIRLADGSMVVAGSYSLSLGTAGFVARFRVDGVLDSSFGDSGFATIEIDGPYGFVISQVLARKDGTLLVVGSTESIPVLVRLRADGRIDETYGDHGFSERVPALASRLAAAMQADDAVVVGGTTYLMRFSATGAADAKFADGGRALIPASVTDVIVTGDGKIVAAGTQFEVETTTGGVRNTRVLYRFDGGGLPDVTFGVDGKVAVGFGAYARVASARIDPWPGDKSATVVEQADGRLVTIAKALDAASGGFQIGLVRHLGTDGSTDVTFGHGGISVGPVGDTLPGVAALDAQGRLLVGLNGPPRLARYVIAQGVDWPVTTTIVTSDRAEVAFGETLWLFAAVAGKTPTGTVEFRVEADGEPQTICTASISGPPWKAACAVGNVGAVPEPLMITALYSGSSTDFPSESPVFVQKVKPPASGAAIEYHNPRFGDYFLTSAPGEIAQLDADPGAGWQRTGQFFLVEGSAAAGTVPMCRFYSGIAYAPYAAHFYTPFADECASLRAGTTWIYEGTVFPVRPSSDGLCPAGTRPLWRLYDRGQGGAPRHRFTVSQRLRYELWSQGWLEESSRTYLADVCARGAP